VYLFLVSLLWSTHLWADETPDAALLEFLGEAQQDGEHWMDPIQVQEMTSNERDIKQDNETTQSKSEHVSQEQHRD